jgi:hypothetical protein
VVNKEGRATAITVLSPVKPWGRPMLALVFLAARRLTFTLMKLHQLSFIHYAHWSVIRRFPDGGAGERLHHSYLLFESNFNGAWDEYIDAFSEVVPDRMRLIWGTSYGFPGPIPVEPFKSYIKKNEYIANHYWSAYPGASTTEIIAAKRVAHALESLQARAEMQEPTDFVAAYHAMLTGIQRDL